MPQTPFLVVPILKHMMPLQLKIRNMSTEKASLAHEPHTLFQASPSNLNDLLPRIPNQPEIFIPSNVFHITWHPYYENGVLISNLAEYRYIASVISVRDFYDDGLWPMWPDSGGGNV